jgi:hypothetical protein
MKLTVVGVACWQLLLLLSLLLAIVIRTHSHEHIKKTDFLAFRAASQILAHLGRKTADY